MDVSRVIHTSLEGNVYSERSFNKLNFVLGSWGYFGLPGEILGEDFTRVASAMFQTRVTRKIL